MTISFRQTKPSTIEEVKKKLAAACEGQSDVPRDLLPKELTIEEVIQLLQHQCVREWIGWYNDKTGWTERQRDVANRLLRRAVALFKRKKDDMKLIQQSFFVACKLNDVEMSKKILELVPDQVDKLLLTQTNAKQIALHLACVHKSTQVLKLLLNEWRRNDNLSKDCTLQMLNTEDASENKPLHSAMKKNASDAVQVILDMVVEDREQLRNLILHKNYSGN